MSLLFNTYNMLVHKVCYNKSQVRTLFPMAFLERILLLDFAMSKFTKEKRSALKCLLNTKLPGYVLKNKFAM